MPLPPNQFVRLCLVLMVLFAFITTPSGLVSADSLREAPSLGDPPVPSVTISVKGDINVLDAELHNVTMEGGEPTAEIIIRNQHPIWYVVSQTGLAISGSTLHTWVVLPPCRAKIRLFSLGSEYDCSQSVVSLGRTPLRQGEEVVLFADGVGADVLAQNKLAMIYGAEVFWRLVFKDALPLDVGTALSDVAFKLADWNLQALNKNMPLFTFYKIGKALSDNDLLQMVSEVNGALSSSAFRAFLESQLGLSAGTLPSGLTTIDVALRIEKVLELPLIFGIELMTSVGMPFGTIRLVPFVSGSTGAKPTPGSTALPTTSSGNTSTILVMDVSPSMNNKWRGGVKITSAKGAATGIIDMIEQDAGVGKRTHTVGITAFDGTATKKLELTSDYAAARSNISTLNVSFVRMEAN